MPELRTLRITFYLDADPDHRSWASDPQVEPLSVAAVPRLTRLTAPAVLLSGLSVPSLQHITLENLYGRYSPEGRLESYRGFYAALAVCALRLQTLVLLDVGPRVYDVPAVPSTSLPALRHFRMADTTRRCGLVLSHLEFPDTTHIACANVDSGRLCETLPTNSASIDAHLAATDRVAIRGTADATSIHCFARADSDSHELICVGLAGARRGLRPDDLIQLFRDGARVTHLAIAGLDGRDAFGVTLRAFPYLVRLDVSGEMAGYILETLARKDHEASDGDTDGHYGDGRRANIVCAGLETLTVDFHFASGMAKRDVGTALRSGNMSVVEADLRRRCADLVKVLSRRSEMGSANITRLELGCTEQGCPVGSNDRKCPPTLQVGLSGSSWAPWRSIVKPLKKLVDGPVVFTGYHFFLASG
uniref:Probable 3-oxoacyl-[acyl-carrier-protein] reductase oxidoreductase (EC) n=1 Tax=Ganoderma boninense TaxID=34458 RepID=A0A5K1JXT3_9APHY|nr:Probable 3-oxoacyl-[acyl-carrier-protein] reductase oxidoreductase (EC [Ganoderma boninense]